MANSNTVVLVSDSAKTRLPESFRKSCYDSSSTLSVLLTPTRRRKMNPDSCRWGETSSESPSSASPMIWTTSRRKRASDSALVLPKMTEDCSVSSGRQSHTLLLLNKASSITSILEDDYDLYSTPFLPQGSKRLSPKNSPQVKGSIVVTRKPTTGAGGFPTVNADSSPRMRGDGHKKSGTVSGYEKRVSKALAKGDSSTMDLKGRAILETVVALSRKAAIAITRDQAMCSSCSADSA
jgi:hypothetical protein